MLFSPKAWLPSLGGSLADSCFALLELGEDLDGPEPSGDWAPTGSKLRPPFCFFLGISGRTKTCRYNHHMARTAQSPRSLDLSIWVVLKSVGAWLPGEIVLVPGNIDK